MNSLRILACIGVISIVPTLSAEVVKPFFTPFILDVSPANCSAATSHIQGTGTGINVFRSTINPDGRVHLGITFNAHGSGKDENGVTWRVTDGDNYFSFNGYLVNGASEFTATENLQLVSQGNTKNIVLHTTVKVKIASDGSITVEFARERGNGEGCEAGFIY